MTELAGHDYEVILADPPWRYDWVPAKNRAVENHYPTMSLREIMDLPVAEIAAEGAILFLWATAPKLREALAVMDAWGFRYRTNAVWDKLKIGMGHYFRGRHEHLLIGRRGKIETPSTDVRPPSVIASPRGRHSAKPVEVHEIIERMYPDKRKIELFARRRRPGWAAWGNELEQAA